MAGTDEIKIKKEKGERRIHMLDINAIERVIDKRTDRGATDQNLINYLIHLKKTAWKNYPQSIDGLIDAIKQTPLYLEN